MTVYLDATVIVPLFWVEPSTATVIALLRREASRPVVSDYAAGEVGSAFARLVRMNALETSQALERLTLFDEWRRDVSDLLLTKSDDIEGAARLVRRFELGSRLPDALHLTLCHRAGLTLVTNDGLMSRAAEAVGVPVVVPAQASPAK